MSDYRNRGHQHGEAFMLMNYACQCGHREIIWNSRDGVTPFATGCPDCGECKLQHVDWGRDVYAPDHALHHGQQYWRDGTPDEAEAIMRDRIVRLRSSYPVGPEREAELIRIARDETSGEFPNQERPKRGGGRYA